MEPTLRAALDALAIHLLIDSAVTALATVLLVWKVSSRSAPDRLPESLRALAELRESRRIRVPWRRGNRQHSSARTASGTMDVKGVTMITEITEMRSRDRVTFLSVPAEVRDAVRAGQTVTHLRHRGHHYMVHITALGVLATINGHGDEDEFAKYASFTDVGDAQLAVHRRIADLIKDQTRAEHNGYFRSWGSPDSAVAVEHELLHHRWHVVVGDLVRTLVTVPASGNMLDDLDDFEGRPAGWAFVQQLVADVDLTPEMEQLLTRAAEADRTLLAERVAAHAEADTPDEPPAPAIEPAGRTRRRLRWWRRRR